MYEHLSPLMPDEVNALLRRPDAERVSDWPVSVVALAFGFSAHRCASEAAEAASVREALEVDR